MVAALHHADAGAEPAIGTQTSAYVNICPKVPLNTDTGSACLLAQSARSSANTDEPAQGKPRAVAANTPQGNIDNPSAFLESLRCSKLQ